MRLCLVTHRLVRGDGQGRVNYELALEALRQGHRVHCLAHEVALELRARAGLSWTRVPYSPLPTNLLRYQVFALASARWLRRHRQEVDLIHANGFITWPPADVNTAHFVHSAWQQVASALPALRHEKDRLYHRTYTALNAALERRAYRQARQTVAISRRVQHELTALGLRADKIEVIHNGVALDEFHPGPSRRLALGLPENVPLALFVGELQTPRKNLDTLLRALTRVPKLHLAVVGRADHSPYPALANRLGVSDRTRFLGFRRDLPELLRAADFAVCPSRYEPYSLVALEALASGIPVIASSAIGAIEIMNEECGLVLPDAEDAEGLADAMRALVENPARREAMGREARRVAEQYSWQRMGQEYLALYARVLDSAQSATAVGGTARHG